MHTMDNIVERASRFAISKHSGQKRKVSKIPYAFHPGTVAWLLTVFKESKNKEMLIAVMLLHDTVEDCGVTYHELEREFGSNVAAIVMELTNEKGNFTREEQIDMMIWKLKTMSTYALTCKMCDFLHNLSDVDPNTAFGKKFIEKITIYMNSLIEREITGSQLKLLIEIQKMLDSYKLTEIQ